MQKCITIEGERFEYEINKALKNVTEGKNSVKKSIATSEIAYDYICGFVKKITDVTKADISVYKIKNNFFGERITVTGLICGSDIISQLKGKDLGEYLLLSASMFKSDCDIFLDDVTKEDVERELGVKVIINDNTGEDFVNSLIK